MLLRGHCGFSRFASFQTRLSTFFFLSLPGVFSPPGPVSGRICLRSRHHLGGKGGRATVARSGQAFSGGGGSCQEKGLKLCRLPPVERVWTASTPTTSPHPAQPHVDWSIGVGVRFSPPPTCRWWSAGKYQTTSTPEDTGQPEEAMEMGVISDPQILRSDRNVVSMPVPLAKVAQISQGMEGP